MRTRGAVEDLVVVDLDDPEEVAGRGAADGRRRFEDRYAELPFGLGTVPRRLAHDPWYVRPGVVLWVAIALIGLVALAGRGGGSDDAGSATPRPTTPTYPVLTERTGADLLFTHLDVTSEFDVDSGVFRVVPPEMLGARDPAPQLDPVPRPADADGRHPLVVRGPTGTHRVSDDGEALAVSDRSVVWRPTRCVVCAIRLTDVRTGRTATLGRVTGAPRDVAVSPGGRRIGLLAAAGPGQLELRLVSASGRVVVRVPLPVDLVSAPMLWSRDGRWLFTVSGATLLAIEARSGTVRRVGNTLPPFESISTE